MSKHNDPKGRNRKTAVWGDTPRRLRRMVVKGDCAMADLPALIRTQRDKSDAMARHVAHASDDGVMAAQDDFHAAIEAPIKSATTHGALTAFAKRSEAAKRAAATRKANAAAKK